jgi:hypothetical protein
MGTKFALHNLLLHMQQKVVECSTRDGRAVLRELLGEYVAQSHSAESAAGFQRRKTLRAFR